MMAEEDAQSTSPEDASASGTGSPLARVRDLIKNGRSAEAEVRLAQLVTELFSLRVSNVTLNKDGYSLNSANGIVLLLSGERLFFKFHQEEGEEETVGEYYRAELLDDAGYPVDRPLHVSKTPGRQILLYRQSAVRRFADVCLDWERSKTDSVNPDYLSAQEACDRLVASRYLATLHTNTAEQSQAEPIHQLFHHRLVDHPADTNLGGRYRRFYVGSTQTFIGANGQETKIPWDEFGSKTWQINGLKYNKTLDQLFEESRIALEPGVLADHPAVTAHGDAHNANVWYDPDSDQKLRFFDPAFAGEHVPALLAEIKATFHNIFAHPLWLYHPDIAEKRLTSSIRIDGDQIIADHSWHLSALRRGFLAAKGEAVWQPLLRHLADNNSLPTNWQQIMRCAFFCCPTLVMDLTSAEDHRDPTTSAVAWSIAVMMGCEPESGHDDAKAFFAKISPPDSRHRCQSN